mmetsp:Transcript_19590/g.49804  ORF Transcript_19590/g.49804 Transcript_19590/m.49804 type:complete len:797 (+) Transcript_19590:27-2417(+)
MLLSGKRSAMRALGAAALALALSGPCVDGWGAPTRIVPTRAAAPAMRSAVLLTTIEQPLPHLDRREQDGAEEIQEPGVEELAPFGGIDLDGFVLREGPPSFFWPMAPEPGSTKPVLLYLPGIEFTGYTISRQLSRLAPHYDVRIFRVSPHDRTAGTHLYRWVEVEIEQLAKAGRRVVLMGESFGGVLALDTVLRAAEQGTQDRITQLVLMNPATCMPATPWPQLASWIESLSPDAYAAIPLAISPLLANPLRLIDFKMGEPGLGPIKVMEGVAEELVAELELEDKGPFPELTAAVSQFAGQALAAVGRAAVLPGPAGWAEPEVVLERLVGLLPILGQLPNALPRSTLAFRVRELDAFAREVNGRDWSAARVPTLVISSSGDLVIPSAAAAREIQRRLLGTRVLTLEGAGHAPLLETDVDLLKILEEAAVLTQPRPKPRDYVGRQELANPELQAAVSQKTMLPIRRLVSPKFFSTTESGLRLPGLSGVPGLICPKTGKQRPILFVSNHQQIGVLDIPLLVEELMVSRKIFVRALAHPVAFGMPTGEPSDELSDQQLAAANKKPALTGVPSNSRGTFSKLPIAPPQRDSSRGGMFGDQIDIATFGAVPVSGRNFFRLLQRKEAVLLYPGGVTEAFKGRDQRYKLLWPEGENESDFMRLASKMNAIVVPVAGVGGDDVIHVADAEDLLKLPRIGDMLREFAATVPPGRPGELFVTPIVIPKIPIPRYYFVFGKPIDTATIDAGDVPANVAAYRQVKAELEKGLDWLLDKRQSDPYAGFVKRVAYEAAGNWTRQAPTFRI